MNTINAHFFATLRDHAGVKSIEMQIPPQTNIADFKALLIEKYPMLDTLMKHTLVSINQEYAFDETVIPESAEIALFPPVSGG